MNAAQLATVGTAARRPVAGLAEHPHAALQVVVDRPVGPPNQLLHGSVAVDDLEHRSHELVGPRLCGEDAVRRVRLRAAWHEAEIWRLVDG